MASGVPTRKTSMFRSYRVSMTTSMQTGTLNEDCDNMTANVRPEE
jgi:hypothetical protein